MSRFNEQVRKLNADLRRDLANAEPPKKRVTFHRAGGAMGTDGLPRAKRHRKTRRDDRQRLRKGDWD
jgi:hypothetical protein